jgi:hypothetical protein
MRDLAINPRKGRKKGKAVRINLYGVAIESKSTRQNRPSKIDPTRQKVGTRYNKNGAGQKKLTRHVEGFALVIFFHEVRQN